MKVMESDKNKNRDRTNPRIESLEQATSIGQALEFYSAQNAERATEHSALLDGIVGQHNTLFANQLAEPNFEQIDTVLKNTLINTETVMYATASDVAIMMKSAESFFPSLLSLQDQEVLESVRKNSDTYGIGSYYANEALKAASSETARAAILASLDARVFTMARQNSDTYGARSYFVNEILKSASSNETRAAIMAALDERVFATARQNSDTYGPGSYFVNETVKAASSKEARAAIAASLDGKVLSTARQNSDAYGPGSYFVNETLKGASNHTVKTVFSDLLMVNLEKSGRDPYSRMKEEQEFLFDAFRASREDKGNTRSGSSAKQERPDHYPSSDTKKHDEAKKIVADAVRANKQYSWLEGVSEQDILRVKNTVLALRAKAEERGESMSDAKVYRKYRLSSETNPKLIGSVQILEAVMNGVNGTIPF